jgi:superfamily II DNA/RNA helicase
MNNSELNFELLGLSKKFVENIKKKGIEKPTPIQKDVFSPILNKKSLIGFSKTGTGKTFAYVLPICELNHRSQESVGIENLVLVPTRELSAQVVEDVVVATGQRNCVVSIVGGESEEKQIAQLKSAKWIVATPGRLLDLLKRKFVNIADVRTIVFDEADRLLDMGFQDDMRAILKYVPKGKAQLLFFTATVHLGLEEMAYEFGIESLERIGTETDNITVEGLDHRVSFVGEEEKFFALAHWLSENPNLRGLVFSNYRDKASHVSGRLKGLGCAVESLTAQLSQGQRTDIMDRFKKQKINVLIASDLAARGIDVFNLDFVINYDLPEDPATYVHRVGRTARAGKKGQAISFVGFEDAFRLEKLEKFLGKPIPRYTFESEKLSGRLPRVRAVQPVQEKPVQKQVVAPKEIKKNWIQRILGFLGLTKTEQKSVPSVPTASTNSGGRQVGRQGSRPRGGGRFSKGRRFDRRRGSRRP